MDRIPLVYILSSGRSGSTLLDLLLGAHDEIWTLGEAQFLPLEIAAGAACGCGEPFDRCPFWQPLLPSLPLRGQQTGIAHFRPGGAGKVLRYQLLPSLLTGRSLPTDRRDVAAYGLVNEEMLRQIEQAARARSAGALRWLVDASKDPYRLAWLEQSGRFDLRVLHVVKDPRAFVYSMTRKSAAPSRRRIWRFAARWAVENALGWQLCQRSFRHRARLVRYEDLASRPGEVMAEIGCWLETPYDPALVESFRRAENHAVGGNAMRWSDGPVRLDTQWRERLRRSDALAISLVTAPVRRLLGYH